MVGMVPALGYQGIPGVYRFVPNVVVPKQPLCEALSITHLQNLVSLCIGSSGPSEVHVSTFFK